MMLLYSDTSVQVCEHANKSLFLWANLCVSVVWAFSGFCHGVVIISDSSSTLSEAKHDFEFLSLPTVHQSYNCC